MEKTQYYNLNKPEVTDPLRVGDFNENADLIDAAIKAVEQSVARAWSADNVPWVFGTLDLTGVAIGDVITISDFEPTLLVMWTRLDIPGLATSGYELRVRRHNTGSYHDFLFEGNTLTVTDMNGEPSTTVQYMLLK